MLQTLYIQLLLLSFISGFTILFCLCFLICDWNRVSFPCCCSDSTLYCWHCGWRCAVRKPQSPLIIQGVLCSLDQMLADVLLRWLPHIVCRYFHLAIGFPIASFWRHTGGSCWLLLLLLDARPHPIRFYDSSAEPRMRNWMWLRASFVLARSGDAEVAHLMYFNVWDILFLH